MLKIYRGYQAHRFEDEDIISASDEDNYPQGKVFARTNLHKRLTCLFLTPPLDLIAATSPRQANLTTDSMR